MSKPTILRNGKNSIWTVPVDWKDAPIIDDQPLPESGEYRRVMDKTGGDDAKG